MANHTWYVCKCASSDDERRCPFCNGGLSACTVCGCAEGSLLTHCPGFQLAPEEQDAIYAGQVIDLAAHKRRRNYNAEHR
jgi:hypothetical protein